jgi:hypothetical protein
MLRWWTVLLPVPVKLERAPDKLILVLWPLYYVLYRVILCFVPHSVHETKTESEPNTKTEDGEHFCDSHKCE